MAKETSTGVKVSCVQGEPATFDQLGFEALTFTQIKQVTNIPTFGPEIQVVTSEPLETGITEKFIGFVNYGSTSIEADLDDEDAGQALALNACTPGDASFGASFSFKIEYASGAVRYFVGKFFSANETPGSANSMIGTAMNLEINSKILKVAAA
jgi:hypothetical protein